MGERIAGGLRELLRDPARAPVLVLATLWPQYWDGLTARPPGGGDPHAQARELLVGHDITVPAAFTAAQLQRLGQAGDVRLAQAAVEAQDGQVIQFLAGVPELMARYRNAPPAAKALIHAAMDARRLGMGFGLPRAFLKATGPGYLTGAEWDALGGDWLERALAYTAVPAKPSAGRSPPSVLARPDPAPPDLAPGTARSNWRAPRPASRPGRCTGSRTIWISMAGTTERACSPRQGFWAAAADHSSPGDQAVLGDAADARGLYRDAAQLHKNAAACSNLRAVLYLSNAPQYLRGDVRPVLWAAAHASLDDPVAVAALLGRLRDAGPEQQAAALLHRDPAAHVCLDNPLAVAGLLGRLREAGAEQQFTVLADRAAAHAPVHDPFAVATLLSRLREAGAEQQAAGLLHRDPAAHVRLDDPRAVATLLASLREAGAEQQASALADRAAARRPLDDRCTAARPREAGAEQQATALADRAAALISLDDPFAVARLLGSLREAGAEQQATVLLRRDPAAHVSRAVAALLASLREASADEQAIALAGRLPGAGMFELFREQQDRQDRFRFGRDADGSPAQPWSWEDLD